MPITKEFIDALNIEIDALKRGKGGNIISIFNGELLQKITDLYVYQFNLENFLIVLDDTPASIEINGKEYDCDIISVSGLQVQILIKHKLADQIPIGKIKTNTWYLLERLRKKFEDNQNTQYLFENSDKLFNDINSKIDGGFFNPTYKSNANEDENPNEFQYKAIESSLNDFISIIWGPPGTGKTKTISKAVESHLNLGRKVLLLSHSNNAVDQALLKIAKELKHSYYKEGQLVRLGIPKSEMSEKYKKDESTLVLIQNIIEHKSKDLIEEKTQLNETIEKTNKSKEYYENIIDLYIDLGKINTQLDNEYIEIQKNESKIKEIENDITAIEKQIIEHKDKLNNANNAGFLKRAFLSLDPKKIEDTIKSLEVQLINKKNQINSIKTIRNQLLIKIEPIKVKKNNFEINLANFLSKIGKNITQVQEEIKNFEKNIKQFQTRLEEINRAVDDLKLQILKDAKLVATTLTKSYVAKEFENLEFDILVIDEISMAPMPMVYWAASKVKKGITIVGDFKQLPPICISDDPMAKKWLGRSLFDQLNITNITNAVKRTNPLYEQFRMHPEISEIANSLIYENRLRDGENVKNKSKYDSIAGNNATCLIDTSIHNPWCSQLNSGGRFNLINALLCINLAEKLINSKILKDNENIGIITPYRSQVKLIQKIAKDRNIPETKIRIDTVHSFQGGEETVIIFDTVEGDGAKTWSLINEDQNTESAKLLLNVALTRAKDKFFVIANYNHIKKYFAENTMFMNILKQIIENGKHKNSTEIMSDLKDENFDYWVSKINSLSNNDQIIGSNFDDTDFWAAFPNDLANTKSEVIIFSPYLTAERLGKLHLIFTEILSKKIQILIITLAPNDKLQLKGATEVVAKLKSMNISVKFREGMHEKIAIIDKKIEWSGSLNILSHNTRKEYMKRFEGENTIKELFHRFDLDELLYNPNLNGEYCPICRNQGIINFIRPKTYYGKSFYGCSGYPECNFTASINIRSIEDLEKVKEKSNSTKQSQSKRTTTSKSTNSSSQSNVNNTEAKQWESPKLFWSSTKLPGYQYSAKKNAWWKAK